MPVGIARGGVSACRVRSDDIGISWPPRFVS
ncbi:hypothetical protein RCH22_003986 [Cryobacterium psychrotolerans]|nr:hypothetical protein [Cryobacterium psychrotolerans]